MAAGNMSGGSGSGQGSSGIGGSVNTSNYGKNSSNKRF